MSLTLRPAADCAFDAISLGEVMLRLDPGEGRVRTTRSFRVWEGGGEYNVTRGLRRCFGLRTAVVTALADNEVGRLIEDLICSPAASTPPCMRWVPYDGIGRTVRNGLNFTERGYGLSAALSARPTAGTPLRRGVASPGTSTGTQRVRPSSGVRWFHTGGIFAGLSTRPPPTCVAEAMTAARRHGTVDLLRPELPALAVEGRRRARPAAQQVNGALAPLG